MNSAFVINTLKSVVAADAGKIATVIDQLRGGWEVWLQVEAAVSMVNALPQGSYVEREETYPAPDNALRADFVLHPALGTSVYVELKVQNHAPDNMLARFRWDIEKVRSLSHDTRRHVIVAAAFMRQFSPPDLTAMRLLTGGTLGVYQLMNGAWQDRTNNPISSPGNWYSTLATFAVLNPQT